ncbi:MAG: nuclear transport factor 2 family protein [Bacteroidota bacterium]
MTDDAVLACEDALIAAMASNDVDALDALLDDRLLFTGLGGVVLRKEDDLNAHRARLLRLTRAEVRERHVVRCGATAVVNVHIEMAGTFAGEPFAGTFRYTRVWCSQEDGWRLLAGHMSPVESEP